MLVAPGLILPVIHQKEGRPVFRVTLTEPLKDAACITKTERPLPQRENEAKSKPGFPQFRGKTES